MNLANWITLFRILLTPVFIGFLLYWAHGTGFKFWAAAVFIIACVTDALDGFISRRFNMRTRIGAWIDPLADKILLASAFCGLAFFPNIPAESRIPIWLSLLALSRDVILMTGSIVIYLSKGAFDPTTNMTGKITTVFQMAYIAWLLTFSRSLCSDILASLVTFFTLLSGVLYLRAGAKLVTNGNQAV